MKENYSYVTLLTNDSYSYGIILLVESMRQVKTKYPLHVLVTDKVSTAVLELLDQLKVKHTLVDTITISEEIHNYNYSIKKDYAINWKNCWTKFHIFKMTQYDKIVFLDADIMLLKNIDHLFEKPHLTCALDGEYHGLWRNNPHFNAGCMVIEPSEKLFNDIYNAALNLKLDDIPKGQIFADQEFLNFYFKDWANKKELHLNKYYNVFGPYIQDNEVADLSTNCYFIHFIGRKPWSFWIKNPNEVYTEFFYVQAKGIIEKRLANFDWNKIRSYLTLTVYAICKNEFNNVRNWLESFGQADYVCILDTGSTDGTWEYLQEAQKSMQNLIISQETVIPWRYDKARNLSMKLIPKETDIFFMADLDEVIKEKDWVQKVKNAWDPIFTRYMYDYHRDLDSNGNIVRTIKEYRIHSREWTHWVNIVHEAIVKDNGEKRFYMDACNPVDIAVWHYAKKDKQTNYMELCERDLEEYPDDWIMRLQLAIEYEIRGENEKALHHFKYILSHDNNLQDFEKSRCFNGIARQAYHNKNYALAEKCFLEGRLMCDYFADNYLEAMEMYFNTQQYSKAVDLGLQAFNICLEAQWCGNYDINNYYPYYVMGMAYWQLKEPFKAIGYLQTAYDKNPSDELKHLIHDYCLIAGAKKLRQ